MARCRTISSPSAALLLRRLQKGYVGNLLLKNPWWRCTLPAFHRVEVPRGLLWILNCSLLLSRLRAAHISRCFIVIAGSWDDNLECNILYFGMTFCQQGIPEPSAPACKAIFAVLLSALILTAYTLNFLSNNNLYWPLCVIASSYYPANSANYYTHYYTLLQ